MRSTTGATARGSTAQATLEWVRQMHGVETLERILQALPPDARHPLSSVRTTDELPYELLVALWRAADRELGASHPRWMEEAGAFAIRSIGQRLYAGLLHKGSPLEFLTQSIFPIRLYYSPGDMVLVEAEPGRAVMRLVGFEVIDALFCRRQVGGITCAIELAGGKDVRVEHVRCSEEGDAFCEWEVRWA
jgi:hypothetical protein